MKRLLFTKVGFLLSSVMLMTFPLQTFAAYNVSLSDGTSGLLNYSLNPGESKSDKFTVANLGDEALTVHVYAADGTKSSQGTFALTNLESEQRTIGKWIHLEKEFIELQPKEKVEVPFTVTAPETITPGTYSGGIATESVVSVAAATSSAPVFATKARLVTKLFVNVPGEKNHKPEWLDFAYNNLSGNNNFTLKFKNSGNTYVIAESKIEIFGFPNAQASDFEISDDMPESLKNEKIKNKYDYTIRFNNIEMIQQNDEQITSYWKMKPLFGSYTAKATVVFYEYDVITGQKINPQTATKEISFMIIDFNIILLTLLLLALAGSTLGAHKIYRHAQRKNSDTYVVQSGETLVNIAKAKNISWKTLAKVNKLKAPYELTSNQKILVPRSEKKKS